MAVRDRYNKYSVGYQMPRLLTLEEKREKRTQREKEAIVREENYRIMARLTKEHSEVESMGIDERNSFLHALFLEEKSKHPSVIWYVADMDYVVTDCKSLEEAKDTCTAFNGDGRKHPVFKKVDGIYEYHTSPNASHPGCWFFGTREAMILAGFQDRIEDYEDPEEE